MSNPKDWVLIGSRQSPIRAGDSHIHAFGVYPDWSNSVEPIKYVGVWKPDPICKISEDSWNIHDTSNKPIAGSDLSHLISLKMSGSGLKIQRKVDVSDASETQATF